VTEEYYLNNILKDVHKYLSNQPDLEIVSGNNFPIFIEGTLSLNDDQGVFDRYCVRIELSEFFPDRAPKVFETAGRIPHHIDRHVFADGHACLTVWPVWLARAEDRSFHSVMDGPIRNFFLSQTIFEQSGHWPFGEYAHGYDGMLQAICEFLGIDPPDFHIAAQVSLLLWKWPKGHHRCGCGSGKPFRNCHRPLLTEVQQKTSRAHLREILELLVQIKKFREAPPASG